VLLLNECKLLDTPSYSAFICRLLEL